MSTEQEVQNAEIVQALSFVKNNYSFSSANNDTDKFKLMFPDSKIAQGYKQGATKIKYVIQYGIAPYIKDCDKEEVRNLPYAFKFDESTNSRVRRQYDAHVQFWSTKYNKITSTYVGSLFLGHCKAEDLSAHFFEMLQNLHLKPTLLLHLGMDGPNVNLKFEQQLAKFFREQYGSEFLTIGTCTLHKVHNAFRKGLNACEFDLETFIFDISFFFKRSACRREDYKTMELVTELESRFVLKHISSRWLSIRKACLRLLEQWTNLEEYFLKFLPTQEGMGNDLHSLRYKRITEVLRDPMQKASFCFVVYASYEFESFLRRFQRDEPMVHLLYDSLLSLLRTLMSNFIEKSTMETADMDVENLLEIDLKRKHKKIKKIDVGTHAKSIIYSSKVYSDDELKWRQKCLNFYESTVVYLKNNLPFSNKILKDARYFAPCKRNDQHALTAISRLALEVANCLRHHLHIVFGSVESVEDVCDKIRNQWRSYQLEDIPNEWFTVGVVEKRQCQESYWEDVETVWSDCTLQTEETPNSVRVDTFWSKIFEIKDNHGHKKYRQLEGLVKSVLTLSHGNSGPESGFSMNQQILESHGNSLSDDTLIAIRRIKHALSKCDILDFELTPALRLSVRQSWQRYQSDLILKRNESQTAKEACTPKKKNELSKIDQRIKEIECGIKVAEEAVEEGNNEMKEILRSSTLNRQKLEEAGSNIEMGVKRKRTLSLELEDLKKNSRLSGKYHLLQIERFICQLTVI